MKLIGAGLPRTGTLSQKIALEMLGFSPCYHMVNVLGDLDEAARWERAVDGEPTWREILADFPATVDWPGAFFYQELVEAYPEAKVLLSVREPEKWVRSMRDTIWGCLYGDSLVRHLCAARAAVEPSWASYLELMARMWRETGLLSPHGERLPSGEAMEAYNERVKATVPPERLLVWSVSDGWEPLCEFLGVPVPDQPFPRVNDSAQFGERLIDGALLALREWREATVEDAQRSPAATGSGLPT
jgi:Sulfotransferase domain